MNPFSIQWLTSLPSKVNYLWQLYLPSFDEKTGSWQHLKCLVIVSVWSSFPHTKADHGLKSSMYWCVQETVLEVVPSARMWGQSPKGHCGVMAGTSAHQTEACWLNSQNVPSVSIINRFSPTNYVRFLTLADIKLPHWIIMKRNK